MSVVPEPDIPARFYVETLGCPKNAVDSDKVTASLLADGLVPASSAEEAELVVVRGCAGCAVSVSDHAGCHVLPPSNECSRSMRLRGARL